MQATGAVWGELLSQVEHRVGQPLLQGLGVLLGIALAQAPGELLIVIDGLIQLPYRNPWEVGQGSKGTAGPE